MALLCGRIAMFIWQLGSERSIRYLLTGERVQDRTPGLRELVQSGIIRAHAPAQILETGSGPPRVREQPASWGALRKALQLSAGIVWQWRLSHQSSPRKPP